MLANALRSHFAELGIVVAQGLRNLPKLIEFVVHNADSRVPAIARQALGVLVVQIQDVQRRIEDLEQALLSWHRSNQTSRRLETIPGIGFITASAIAATVTDPSQFASGRQFAPGSAWCLAKTPAAARSGSAVSPKWETGTFVVFWSSVPPPSFASHEIGQRR